MILLIHQKIKELIDKFSNKEIDIIVATQIMAKGYDFPNLSLVGVIDADAGLFGGDMRAIEKTYNMLQQVSGRAGRSQQTGKVIIQTYYPDNLLFNRCNKGTGHLSFNKLFWKGNNLIFPHLGL